MNADKKTSDKSAELLIDWRELVYRGVESQTLDYKAAQNWNNLTRVGKAKFARHAMAMANTRGGYLVVGVGEDENGNPTRYTGLTESQLRSFDPADVGQFVNLFSDPSVDFDIVRPEIDGSFYAVFVIRRFSGLPHVCSDHCGDELQQGIFYVRTPDARSRSAYRASELHGLVQRALRNQREALGRMLRGVLYEGRQYPEEDAEQEFTRLLQESKAACRKWIGPRNLQRFVSLELAAYPPDNSFSESVNLSDLKKAVADIAVPVGSDFPLSSIGEEEEEEVFFTNQSLTSRHAPKREGRLGEFHFWQFFRLGLFHHLSSLNDLQSGGSVSYPLLVNRIGAAIEVVGELYSELGCEGDILTFSLTLNNVEGSSLIDLDIEEQGEYLCYIPEVVVCKRRSVADLISDPVEHATRWVREVCERFNLPSDQHPELRQRLHKLLGD